MRVSLAIGILTAVLAGCSAGSPGLMPPGQFPLVFYDNPSLIPLANYEFVWETVADVVDDYFHIEREEPVRLIGNTLTEGRIDTIPEVSPTLFEPWRQDAANSDQRVENTLQSIRRKAQVRVIPAQGGFWVEVIVLKELEDTKGRPEFSTAGTVTLRTETTLTRVINPLVGPAIDSGWVPQGRDTALEQRILGHLHARLGGFAPPAVPVLQSSPPGLPTAVPGVPGIPPVPCGSTGQAPVPCGTPGTFAVPTPSVQQCLLPIWPASSLQYAEPGVSSGAQRTCFFPPDVSPLDSPGVVGLAWPQGSPRSNFAPESSDYEAYRLPIVGQFLHDAWLDYQQFYSCRGLTCLGLGLGTAAILANTPLDEHFQQWYHDHAQSSGSDHFADAVRDFGNGWYAIPAFAGAALLGPYCANPVFGAAITQWGDRCLRTVVVAGPPVLFLQVALGNTRPFVTDAHSRWIPFDDNHGVSGHAFIGAIPFITAAQMCDDVGFKLVMYTLSTFTAWSRVNDDRHFLSQALLGWWLAYLGATAVSNTEQCKRDFAIIPLTTEECVGVGAIYQW